MRFGCWWPWVRILPRFHVVVFLFVWGAANWAFLAAARGMKPVRAPGTCQEPQFHNSRLDDTRQWSLGRAQAPSALHFLLISADGTVSVCAHSCAAKGSYFELVLPKASQDCQKSAAWRLCELRSLCCCRRAARVAKATVQQHIEFHKNRAPQPKGAKIVQRRSIALRERCFPLA